MDRLRKLVENPKSSTSSQGIPPGSSVVEMVEVEKKKPAKAEDAGFKHLFTFASKKHLAPLVVAIITTLATSALKTFLAVVYGNVFNILAAYGAGTIGASEALADVSLWCVVLTAMGVGTWIANGVFLGSWVIFGEEQAKAVRHDVFASLMEKDMAWYDGQADGIASLLTRIESQTRELQMAASQPFGLLISDLLSALGSFIIALYFSWKLALVLAATLPVSIAILNFATRSLPAAIQAQKAFLAQASKLSSASITAIDLVKIFNGFDSEVWQYIVASRKATVQYLIQARCNALQMAYVVFWMAGLFVVGFWYGTALVDDGSSPGDILTTFYAVLAAFQGVEALVPQWLVLTKGMAAGASLREIATKKGSGKSKEKAGTGRDDLYSPFHCVGHVDVIDVSFAYPTNPSEIVLSPSSFVFPAGEITYVVGRSGSGKSTLGNLLLRFYEPLSGEIRVDGRPIGDLSMDWLRKNITLVQQSSVLFDDTLFNNVSFGHRNPDLASDEEVRAACEAALLQATIAAMPEGLNTMVGSGGFSLSGGQKQRVALARARLRNPPILILDEITSGLDQVTRTLVMDAIRQWRRGKTTIIITHDVAQIDNSDFVYVMDEGEIVQQGFAGSLQGEEDGFFAMLVAAAAENMDYREADETFEEILTDPESPVTPTFPSRGRISTILLESLDHGIFYRTAGLPRGGSIGADFSLSADLQRSRLWEAGKDQSPSTSNPYRVRWSIMDVINAAEKKQAYDEDNEGDSDLDMSDFGLMQRMGQSVQASRLHDFNRRRRRARSKAANTPAGGKDSEDNADKPTGKYDINTPITRLLATVWPNLSASQRAMLILGLISCAVSAGVNPAFAFCFAQLLAAFWAPVNRAEVGMKWALLMLGLGGVDALAGFGNRYCMEHAGQSWIDAVRVQALTRILRQPKAWFDRSRNSPGKVSDCLDRNAEEMRNLVGRFVPRILIVVGMMSAAVIWAMVVSWKLTLVALSPGPIVLASVKALSIVGNRWEAACNDGADEATALARQTFTNVRVVRTFTLESHFERKYEASVAKTFALGVKRALYTGIFYGLQQSMNLYVTALVFYYGMLILAQDDAMPVADVLQVTNLLLLAIGASTAILTSIPQISAARATAVQMLNYASLPQFSSSENRGAKKLTTPFPVRFQRLSFTYPSRPDQPILRNLSLVIEANTSTAVVGPSGCGKSTLLSILLGLYPPTSASAPPLLSIEEEGEDEDEKNAELEAMRHAFRSPTALSFAGTPWTEVDIQHLRSMSAYVPQAPFLFPASIAENITYGLPEADTNRTSARSVEAAARLAGIHDFISSLPEGYTTLVGDGGMGLSGGQAQRVCIARALARRPRLLVMDEPTSALDMASAEAVRAVVSKLAGRGGMSVVVVTHCRDMMRAMERVVVLEGGFVVEQGGYDELLGRRGRLAALVSGD